MMHQPWLLDAKFDGRDEATADIVAKCRIPNFFK